MGSEPHHEFRIIKIPSAIAPRVIEYVSGVMYDTHSRAKKSFVTRNAFEILKIEAVHNGTLLHLELFGREKERRFNDLKKFVEELEARLTERMERAAAA